MLAILLLIIAWLALSGRLATYASFVSPANQAAGSAPAYGTPQVPQLIPPIPDPAAPMPTPSGGNVTCPGAALGLPCFGYTPSPPGLLPGEPSYLQQ